MSPMSSKLQELLLNFSVSTTLHGISRVTTSRTPWLRVLWTILTIGALIFFNLHFSELVKTFKSVPTSFTTYKDSTKLAFKYPTITLCNAKVLTGSVLNNFTFGEDGKLSASNSVVQKEYSQYQNATYQLFVNYDLNLKERSVMFTETFRDTFTNFYSEFQDFSKHQMDIKYMLIDCLVGVNEKGCSHEDFVEIRHPQYLRCFMFNSSLFLKEAEESQMTQEDIDNGLALHLHLTLFTDSYPGTESTNHLFSDNYGLRYDEGVVLQIHDPKEYPLTENFETLLPGMEADYKVVYRKEERVNTPGAPCSSQLRQSTISYKNMLVANNGSLTSGTFEYRTENCRMATIVADTQALCNCSLFEFPVHEPLTQLKFCHDLSRIATFDKQRLSLRRLKDNANWIAKAADATMKWRNCTRHVLRHKWRNMKTCKSQCIKESYDESSRDVRSIPGLDNEFFFEVLFRKSSITAYENWESLAQSHQVEKFLERAFYYSHYKKFPLLRQKNIIRIRFSAHPRPVTLIQESRTYVMSSLFAELGGLLGLYMGVSVLTLAELIQLFVQFVHCLFSHRCTLFSRKESTVFAMEL